MIVEMGKGMWLFSMGTDDQGRNGLLIRSAEKSYEVGELDHEKAGQSPLKDDDIFIVIPDLVSALILQEQIVDVCVHNQGWKRQPPPLTSEE